MYFQSRSCQKVSIHQKRWNKLWKWCKMQLMSYIIQYKQQRKNQYREAYRINHTPKSTGSGFKLTTDQRNVPVKYQLFVGSLWRCLGLSCDQIESKLLNELSERQFMCLSSDASNHGNIKLMPVVVRYFIPTVGIKVKLLDFSSEKGESSEIISSLIIKTAEKNQKNNNQQNRWLLRRQLPHQFWIMRTWWTE